MDKSIPVGAAILLRFIYKTEVSREEPECYDVIYGHNQDKLPKPITKMTIGEIQAVQLSWSKRFGSSATGAAQFMHATLKGLISELKLSTSIIFDANLQDRLAYHLLKRRGYLDFMGGRISRTEFGKRLAQEWASFPVLAPTMGAHRSISRGQSYYAGDNLNRSLVKPETVEGVLDHVKAAGNGLAPVTEVQPDLPLEAPTHVIVDAVDPIPNPVADPAPTPKRDITAIIVSALAGAAVGVTWLTNLPCSWLGIACGN